jgi:hypothetical protein
VNTRPLPPYDKSYGPLPANDATNDDLLKRYSCTKPTLFKRRDPLVDRGWIKPTKVASRLYYAVSDVMLLDQCSFWASKGYTIPEIIVHLTNEYKRSSGVDGEVNAFVHPLNFDAPEGAVDVESNNATTELIVRGLQSTPGELGALTDKAIEKLGVVIGKEIRKQLPQDHLGSHDFLAKAADKDYLLTGKLLGEGIGMRSSTVANWGNEVEKFGFLLSRVGKGQWRVKRLPS